MNLTRHSKVVIGASILVLLAIGASILFLPATRTIPAPSSNLTEAEALTVARTVAQAVGGFVVRGTGESMLPFLPDNSIAVARAIDGADLRAGQIILYTAPDDGALVMHYLERETPRGWQTRGYNHRSDPDPYTVTEDMVAGVVVAVLYYTP